MEFVIPLEQVSLKDIEQVGGKGASLGEMLNHLDKLEIDVPGGFAVTASAYLAHIQQDNLYARIEARLRDVNVDDVSALASAGEEIRAWIKEQELPADVIEAITQAYQKFKDVPVAVRSSATAEDLPSASFAGQQESFLNVNGLDNVVQAVRDVYASLYTDRAIAYRVHHGFKHEEVAISVTIQRMIRSDKACSGVLFTVDTESGFDQVVFITAGYGLGELIVQGAINPDEYYVYKPNILANKPAILSRHLGSKSQQMIFDEDTRVRSVQVKDSQQQTFCLQEDEVCQLAKMAIAIENHYGVPMDVEWAKDGIDGKLYILQARPETVTQKSGQVIERYHLNAPATVITKGRSIGQKIGAGIARVVTNVKNMQSIMPGEVLVADMTDPDWEPVMKKVSAIVTNRGGRTCHAAIIARELGIPAVVGCNDATETIQEGQAITVSCAEGDTGMIYDGALEFQVEEIKVDTLPQIPVDIMMNIANPERAMSFANLPNAGVGLARLEFLISNSIGIHPRAALDFANMPTNLQADIEARMGGAGDPIRYYIDKLRDGIATICAAFAPKPVIVRLSDFKSNEYANLIGGKQFEPNEENPMLGFRGCGRYISPEFAECFALECEAVKAVRYDMGFDNLKIMIPFVRTLKEAELVNLALEKNGIKRGKDKMDVYMMCELPGNCLLAHEFLQYFDGFSIGSNDLTQLTLGVDRDSALVASSFDERDQSVKKLLSMAIQACNQENKYVGICGQAPSDYPEFAKWLVEQGIQSMSLNPDSVIDTWMFLAKN